MKERLIDALKAAVFLCSAIVILSVLPGCSKPLTREQRLADLNYLLEVLSENHPYVSLKSRIEGYDWIAHRPEFVSLVADTRTDRDFAVSKVS